MSAADPPVGGGLFGATTAPPNSVGFGTGTEMSSKIVVWLNYSVYSSYPFARFRQHWHLHSVNPDLRRWILKWEFIYSILQCSSPAPSSDNSAIDKAKKGSRALKKADAKKKLLQMPSLVPKNPLAVKELSARLARIIKEIIADLDFEDKEVSSRLAKILSNLKKMDDFCPSARLAEIDCEIKRIIDDL